jgi:hypothetical protein
MSFGIEQMRAFLNPLRGKVTTFSVADRATNLSLGRLILSSVAVDGDSTIIMDTDAFYASNSVRLAENLSQQDLNRFRLYVPETGASGEDVVIRLFRRNESCSVSIIDNLNTLFHLLSSDNPSSAGRKLSFLTALQSFLGRMNSTTVLITVYEREKPTQAKRPKAFSELGEISVHVGRSNGQLSLKCERGAVWPGNALSFPLTQSSG